MPRHRYQVGDWVSYRMMKASSVPGPRAQQVSAAARGELYSYSVEKFWVITGVREDGQLEARTRRGKRHVLEPGDPRLKPATWWQRWVFASRFREIEHSLGQSDDEPSS
jgi:hypothetical protein